MSDLNKGAMIMCLANAVMMSLGFQTSASGAIIAALTILFCDYFINKVIE